MVAYLFFALEIISLLQKYDSIHSADGSVSLQQSANAFTVV